MRTIHLEPGDKAADLGRRAFPGYTGKHFQVLVTAGPVGLLSYWDGGSRDYHRVLRLEDMAVVEVPQNGTPFDRVDYTAGGNLLPCPGFAVVTNTIVQGRDLGLTIKVHPDNVNNLALPAPVDLTWAEKVVLSATRSVKSSYAGISNYRCHEARRYTGIAEQDYNAAKVTLIASGMLNAAGAITAKGRNAIGGTCLYELRPQQTAA
jgi:hypothetical protein